MKKVMSLLLAVMMVLSLAACGGNDTKTDNDIGSSATQNQTDVTDTSSTEQSKDTPSSTTSKPITTTKPETSKPSTTTKPSTPTHTHSYSNATCTEPAKCSCGATNGSALGHSYDKGLCQRCNEKDQNYKPPIQKIDINTPVTLTAKGKTSAKGVGDVEITVLGFEKTTWKAEEKFYDFDDLSATEEIGMLKLIVKNISYINNDSSLEYSIEFEEILQTVDKYGVALNSINSGNDYGSFHTALLASEEVLQGATKRVAIPYIFDVENTTIKVVLGEKYEIVLPVE